MHVQTCCLGRRRGRRGQHLLDDGLKVAQQLPAHLEAHLQLTLIGTMQILCLCWHCSCAQRLSCAASRRTAHPYEGGPRAAFKQLREQLRVAHELWEELLLQRSERLFHCLAAACRLEGGTEVYNGHQTNESGSLMAAQQFIAPACSECSSAEEAAVREARRLVFMARRNSSCSMCTVVA